MERANLDPCVRECLSEGLGADGNHLQSVASYYKTMRNNSTPLPPPLSPLLCPGTIIKADGKTIVLPPRAPRNIVRSSIVPPGSSHMFALPEGWGDDEVYTWQIGRPEQDYVIIKRDRGELRDPRYEERTVIHPMKNLLLRFPSLGTGTLKHVTPKPDDFSSPNMRIRVSSCQCLTAPGCDKFKRPRYGAPQCTFLGIVEMTPAGSFTVFCERLSAIDGDAPPVACGFSGDGQDIVFTVIE